VSDSGAPRDPFSDDPTSDEPLIVPMSDGPMPPSEPTQVMPSTPPPPTGPITGEIPITPSAPTHAMPQGAPVPVPVAPKRWYEDPGPRAAVIVVGLALLFLLIAGLIWWANDDDDGQIATDDSTVPSTSVVASSTSPSSVASSTVPVSTQPASTAPASTQPSTSAPTTTSVTTTLAPTTVVTTAAPTTVAPTTRPPTTTAAPTTFAPTTAVPTTLPAPVVTEPADPDATLWDVINATPDLSGVRELIVFSGTQAEFESADPRTFLAPRNEAIEAYANTSQGATVLANPNAVRELLLDHLTAGAHNASALLGSDQFEALSDRVFVVDQGAQTIGGARIVLADVDTANGVLHVISKVLGT
jgi:uncharacterized surface protein with fasciclin (FAS1) repeats